MHLSLIMILTVILLDSTGISILAASRNSTDQTSIPTFVVELAIFCDKAFSEYFDNDDQALKNHLITELWDLSMRFRTLQSTRISFRVTSVNIFKKTAKQPFIKDTRDSVSDTSLETIDTQFKQWIYKNMKSYPQFDVALLLTGQLGFESYRCLHGAVCQLNSRNGVYKSTITIRFSKPNWRGCGDLARPFGKLFGASCESEGFVMCDDCSKENANHYFFSRDSNIAILKTLTSHQATCLLETDLNTPAIFTTGFDEVHPKSIENQCQFQLETSFELTVEDNEECFKSTCYKNNVSYGDVYPMENSPCGNGKQCFRGKCRPNGHLIRNVGSGYYLQSSDLFSIYDYAILVECLDMASPLERILVTQFNNKSYLQLATSIPNTEDGVNYKCLAISSKNQHVRFMHCKANDTFHKNNAWQIKYVGSDEFILYHEMTQLCAMVKDDLEIIGHKDCSRMDLRVRWKFDNELSENVNSKCATRITTEPWQGNCYSELYFILGVVCSLVFTLIILGMKIFLRARKTYANIPVSFTRDES